MDSVNICMFCRNDRYYVSLIMWTLLMRYFYEASGSSMLSKTFTRLTRLRGVFHVVLCNAAGHLFLESFHCV